MFLILQLSQIRAEFTLFTIVFCFRLTILHFLFIFFFDCLEPKCTYCFEDARSQPSIKQIFSTLKSCLSTQELLAAQHMFLWQASFDSDTKMRKRKKTPINASRWSRQLQLYNLELHVRIQVTICSYQKISPLFDKQDRIFGLSFGIFVSGTIVHVVRRAGSMLQWWPVCIFPG